MKIIGIEDQEEKKKQLNRKKIVISVIVSVIILIILLLLSLYIANKPFRDFMDKYVLMKNVLEDNSVSISIDENETNYIYAFNKYITVLNNNTLKGYNSSGKQEFELKVEIANPMFDQNNRFLLIAEKDKKKIYLIESDHIVWENELEGNISRISVNKNGYVSVVLSGTTYKSVIQTFDTTGKEIFKTYLSNTIAIDTDISFDNKYLSFAEVNTDGTVMNTTIKTISIQKAKETPSESIISSVEILNNNLMVNMRYQDGNKLICFYNDSIYLIKDGTSQILMSLDEENKKITFADINLTNYIVRVVEKSVLLSTENTIEIMNIANNKINIYTLDGVTKEIYCYENQIAINLGTEVHFIGTNGWLIKKYISNQEIKKIVMGNNFAGIVYRDKIEIINL